MKETKTINSTLPVTTNMTIDSSTQTPIEIALQIDENGMTTASNLYAFLELEPKNFSHWCLRNIKKNKFAIENEDYTVFVFENENPKIGGRPKTDYKITSDFAKKLSMTGNTERHEQARQYFIACEQGLKIAAQKLQSNNSLTQITESLNTLMQALTTLTTNITTMQQDIQELKQSQRNRYLSERRYPSAWYKKIAPKYKMLMEYFGCSRSELYSSIYKELEDSYDIDINQMHEDYCYENHLLKNECYPMDAIEHNSKLRDALTLLIDSSLVKYGLQTEDEIRNFKRKTLFDAEPISK
ncbi:antA/AntB antirepressor family protein [uncultured Thomasclavelia sp.]|uniref:antA/AntB antirepressor family protein n=1 Tax=uncultured Thomasclavelia sp. TaxID=3025759 RepID=UPI00280AC2A7|nr:antA/AntB antirepressor family protein [uncultured Thomasclavelia sp.]